MRYLGTMTITIKSNDNVPGCFTPASGSLNPWRVEMSAITLIGKRLIVAPQPQVRDQRTDTLTESVSQLGASYYAHLF